MAVLSQKFSTRTHTYTLARRGAGAVRGGGRKTARHRERQEADEARRKLLPPNTTRSDAKSRSLSHSQRTHSRTQRSRVSSKFEIHSLTHFLTHTHSLPHSLTHFLSHSHSLTSSLTHSLTHSCTYSLFTLLCYSTLSIFSLFKKTPLTHSRHATSLSDKLISHAHSLTRA